LSPYFVVAERVLSKLVLMAFWSGVFLGFVASLLANHCWELLTRYRTLKTAARLVGTWIAYNIRGRMIEPTPMTGAGETVVSAKPHWWSHNSAVLDVRAEDINPSTGERRDHSGHIVFNPSIPWLATRIDRYFDSHEISGQRLVMGTDLNTVYVFPVSAVSTLGDVYAKHAWRRKP
jgi:hypothetical protein